MGHDAEHGPDWFARRPETARADDFRPGWSIASAPSAVRAATSPWPSSSPPPSYWSLQRPPQPFLARTIKPCRRAVQDWIDLMPLAIIPPATPATAPRNSVASAKDTPIPNQVSAVGHVPLTRV